MKRQKAEPMAPQRPCSSCHRRDTWTQGLAGSGWACSQCYGKPTHEDATDAYAAMLRSLGVDAMIAGKSRIPTPRR